MTLILLDDDVPARAYARVPEGEAAQESPLRDIIYDHPTILPLAELDPGIGRVVSVCTELRLPNAGYIDVLLVSEHGKLIIVECKLWRNPQARREVMSQILDYASELSNYAYEDLQRVVSGRLRRPGNVLYELVQGIGADIGEAAFVDRVARDLRAGRFMLLAVGDGITDGVERIGQYLRRQASLAFDLGLIEMAEYRFEDPLVGRTRRIMQPRLLARTVVLERHVIRNETPGVVVEAIDDQVDAAAPVRREGSGANTAALAAWRAFTQRFAAEIVFDDPAQLAPRWGGVNWMRVPLPGPADLTLFRSAPSAHIGAFVRYRTAEGFLLYDALASEREAIDQELQAMGFAAPNWLVNQDDRMIELRHASPLPWNAQTDDDQHAWFAGAANAMINALRPRLQRLTGPE